MPVVETYLDFKTEEVNSVGKSTELFHQEEGLFKKIKTFLILPYQLWVENLFAEMLMGSWYASLLCSFRIDSHFWYQ